jgi:hypothetical protein
MRIGINDDSEWIRKTVSRNLLGDVGNASLDIPFPAQIRV